MTHVKQSVNGSTILTDEIVEKAARAIFVEKTGLQSWEGTVFKDRFCDYARAALQAVLPDVVEKCAKVADQAAEKLTPLTGVGEDPIRVSMARAAIGFGEDIATAIRSLLNKEGNANG